MLEVSTLVTHLNLEAISSFVKIHIAHQYHSYKFPQLGQSGVGMSRARKLFVLMPRMPKREAVSQVASGLTLTGVSSVALADFGLEDQIPGRWVKSSGSQMKAL